MQHIEKLQKLGACSHAIDFAKAYTSMQEAWDNCPYPNWMGWYLKKSNFAKIPVLELVTDLLREEADKTGIEEIISGMKTERANYFLNKEYVKYEAIEVLDAWRNNLDMLTRRHLMLMLAYTKASADIIRKHIPEIV